MSSSGSVTIRFDVQGNEKLLSALTTLVTGSEKATAGVTKLQSTLGGLGVGNLGPLNNIATSVKNMEAGMGTAATKVATFKEKLAGIGTQLGQNATSFGVATASIWGVYNAYDSLEKVQIRAHAAAVKVQTLETSLAALIERRRIATEKGNLTAEQMSILNEKIANTQEKLSVAQERSADVAQDVQEAWGGFLSTVGPQIVAASGSLIQLGTVFKSTFASGGGFINTLKNAFIGLIPSLSKARAEGLLLSPALGGLAPKADQASGAFGKLKSALSGIGVGGALFGAGLAAAGGFLIALAVDSVNTANKVRELQMALKDLEVGSSAAFKNIADQAKVFNQSLTGQIGGALADSNKTIFGTTPIIGFNFREVFEKRLQEDTGTIRADIAKNLETIMSGATASLARDISPETKSNIDKGVARIKEYLIDSSKKNFATPESTLTTFDVMKPIAAKLQADLESLPGLIAGGKVDISGLMTKQTAEVNKFAEAIVKDLGGAAKAASVPTSILNNNIDLLIQSMIEGQQVTPEMGNAIKAAVADILKGGNDISNNFATMTKTVGITGVGIRHMGDDIAYTTAQTDPWNAALVKDAGALEIVGEKTDYVSGVINAQSKEVSDNTAKYTDLQKGLSMYMDTSNASIGELEHWTKTNDATIKSITEQRTAIQDNISFWERMTQTTFDAAIANSKWITAHTNVTKILDGSRESVLAFTEAEKEGTIAAQDWFTNMVLGTVKTETMTKAIAESAKVVGIHADMMAFSSGKAQELITSANSLNRAFNEQAIAAATDVSWLNDKKIIDAQLNAGMLEGAQAANDWTADMIKSTQAAKDNHGQLVALATEMTGLSDISGLTSEQLQTLMQRFQETHDAAGSLASVMRDQLVPIFEPLKSFLTATNWKDFNSAFKDLDLKKLGIPKDLRDSLKEAGKDLLHVNENALEAKTGLSALFTVAFTGRSKGIKSGIKEFLDDLKEIPTMGDLSPFISQMQAIMDLPKEERAAAFKKMGPAILEMMKALAPDENGFVIITPEEIDKINKALGETGPSAQGSVPGIDALNTSLSSMGKTLGSFAAAQLNVGESSPLTNLFLKQQGENLFGGGDGGTTQKTPEIAPPKPIVFPPPIISNITKAIETIEQDLGSMVDFAANLVLSFPPMNIDAINEGLTTAEENLGSIIDFTGGLVATFPGPNIEALNAGLTTAEQNLGSIIGFVAGLKPVFPPVNIIGIANSTSNAKKAAATLVTDIAKLKPAFPAINIVAVANSTSNAKKAASTLETHLKGLDLKFPKMDISEIEKGVNAAQKKIDSLHGKNVTNTITTKYETSGSPPKARGGVEYRESATNTTWGEGGPEVAVFMPLTRAGQPRKGDYDIRIPSPVLDTSGIRNMLRDNRGGVPTGSKSSSTPTVVNVTTQVYLFPGSDMFKKFVKSIMLEEMSRYATA
jgi:hypothetical protein